MRTDVFVVCEFGIYLHSIIMIIMSNMHDARYAMGFLFGFNSIVFFFLGMKWTEREIYREKHRWILAQRCSSFVKR